MDFSNFPWFALGMCLFFVAMGLKLIVENVKKKKACTLEVEGKVVDIIRERGDGQTVYGVVYAYEYNGKTYRKHPEHLSSRRPQVQPGDSHNIKIDPNKPQVCCSGSEKTVILFGVWIIIFSFIVATFFLVFPLISKLAV